MLDLVQGAVGGYAGEILNDLGFKRNKSLQKQVDNGKDIIQLTSKEAFH